MLTEEILRMILIGSATVLVLVLAVAAFELIRTLRWVRYTAEDLQPTIKQATEVLENLGPTIQHANEILETLEPALKRADPLMERVSLTIDAVNLEIMRADQILANLTDVTDVASNAAKKVSTITDTPLNLLTSATDKVRTIFTDRKTEKDTQAALNEAGFTSTADNPAEPETTLDSSAPVVAPTAAVASEDVEKAPEATSRIPDEALEATVIEADSSAQPIASETEIDSAVGSPNDTIEISAEMLAQANSADNDSIDNPVTNRAEDTIPPYQDDIDIIEPEGEVRPQWPF
jgi:hypothetical protein